MSLQPRCPLPWMDLRLGFRRIYPTWLKLCFLTHLGVILERSGSPLHTFSWSECYLLYLLFRSKTVKDACVIFIGLQSVPSGLYLYTLPASSSAVFYVSYHREVDYYLTRTYNCVINPVATYNKLFSIYCFNCWWITSIILYFLQAGTSHNIHMYFIIFTTECEIPFQLDLYTVTNLLNRQPQFIFVY